VILDLKDHKAQHQLFQDHKVRKDHKDQLVLKVRKDHRVMRQLFLVHKDHKDHKVQLVLRVHKV
jgi:hypothetical protein